MRRLICLVLLTGGCLAPSWAGRPPVSSWSREVLTVTAAGAGENLPMSMACQTAETKARHAALQAAAKAWRARHGTELLVPPSDAGFRLVEQVRPRARWCYVRVELSVEKKH